MISREVEEALHDCFVSAHGSRHRAITVEHLLLELLNRSSAVDYLASRSINVDALRLRMAAVVSSTNAATADEFDFNSAPTQEFQHVIQRSILAAQANGHREVSLVAMLEIALAAVA